MAAPLALEALVLGVRDFGDAHRIVDLFSREHGRLSAVARNARSSRRRFGGALDLFVSVRAQLRPGRDLWTLEEAQPVDARTGIRQRLELVARASIACEATKVLFPDSEPAAVVYDALLATLDRLARGELAAAAGFYPRLLVLAGIAPDLSRCVRCDASQPRLARIDADAGGALCTSCQPHSPPFRSALVAALNGGAVDDEATARELERLAVSWIEAQVHRPLESAAVFIE